MDDHRIQQPLTVPWQKSLLAKIKLWILILMVVVFAFSHLLLQKHIEPLLEKPDLA